MPKKLISLSLQDIIKSLMKGGDFMGIEQGKGEQYDPAAVAIAEQQGPVNPDHETAIRGMIWGKGLLQNQRADEGNNDRFPERVMIERP